eukprot:180917-Pelagomonas_calceolata.AAC.1
MRQMKLQSQSTKSPNTMLFNLSRSCPKYPKLHGPPLFTLQHQRQGGITTHCSRNGASVGEASFACTSPLNLVKEDGKSLQVLKRSHAQEATCENTQSGFLLQPERILNYKQWCLSYFTTSSHNNSKKDLFWNHTNVQVCGSAQTWNIILKQVHPRTIVKPANFAPSLELPTRKKD